MDNIKCRIKVLSLIDELEVDVEDPVYLGRDIISICEAKEFEEFIKDKRIADVTGGHEYHSSYLEAAGDKEFADQWYYVIVVKSIEPPEVFDIRLDIGNAFN
jgi:hypothetical protein